MYKCGLVSVSFRNNTVEEIVKAVKYAGLSCIEWGSDVHAKNTDKILCFGTATVAIHRV